MPKNAIVMDATLGEEAGALMRDTGSSSRVVADPVDAIAQQVRDLVSRGVKQAIPAGSMTLTRDQLNDLERSCGTNFKHSEHVVQTVRRMATVSVAGCEIQLPEDLLRRLKSRCIGKQDFAEWLQRVIVLELQHYVGLR